MVVVFFEKREGILVAFINSRLAVDIMYSKLFITSFFEVQPWSSIEILLLCPCE